MTYREILLKTKQAKNSRDLLDVYLLAKEYELSDNATKNESYLLLAARSAVRKALECQTFTAVAKLEKAYAKIHRELFFDEKAAEFFFSWLLVDKRMKRFYESQFGQGVKILFKTHPKLTLAVLDERMVTVSGARQ